MGTFLAGGSTLLEAYANFTLLAALRCGAGGRYTFVKPKQGPIVYHTKLNCSFGLQLLFNLSIHLN